MISSRKTSSVPPNTPLWAALQSALAARGDDIVLIDHDEASWTAAALLRSVQRIRAALLEAGHRSGDPVGILGTNNAGTVAPTLACYGLGSPFVPLDLAWPAQRRERVAKVACLSLVWDAEQACVRRLGSSNDASGSLPRTFQQPDGVVLGASPTPAPGAATDCLAYILFTSGSTGDPKGVMVLQSSVLHLVQSAVKAAGIPPGLCWSMVHSYAFDFSIWEVMGALLTRGRLAIAPKGLRADPPSLLDWLHRREVGVLSSTPTLLRSLLDAAETGGVRPPSPLRHMVFGGEALRMAEVARCRRWLEQQACGLHNFYGITETTVHSTHVDLRDPRVTEGLAADASPIGGALPLWSIVLRTADGLDPSIGEVGEVLVGGLGLACGYLGQPRLTAKRFIPDPAGGPPGSRLYCSGDLAYRDATGHLLYVGRADRQIKRNGFRIELEEIERAAMQVEGVSACRALAFKLKEPATGVSTDAIGLAVMSRDEASVQERVQAKCRELLPHYMCADAYLVLPSFPLTVNGKVDDAELKALLVDHSARSQPPAIAAPSTQAEQVMLQAWREVLDVQSIGLDDNFFAVGGDSISAVRLSRRLARLGFSATVRDVFKRQTVRALAAALAFQPAAPAGSSDAAVSVPSDAPPAARAEPGGFVEAPLSYLQELMVEASVAPEVAGQGCWRARMAYIIQDSIGDVARWRSSLQALVQEQPAFRSGLVRRSGRVFQRIHAEWAPSLTVHPEVQGTARDLATVIQNRLDRCVNTWTEATLCTGEALARFELQRSTDGHTALILDLHHAFDDGWGNEMMLPRLLGHYRTGTGLGSTTLQDYLVHVSEQLSHEARQTAALQRKGTWESTPAAAAASPSRTADFRTLRAVIAHERVQAILDDCRRQGVSPKAGFLRYVLDAMLGATGRPSLRMGVVANGRGEHLTQPFRYCGLHWALVPLVASNEPVVGLADRMVEAEATAGARLSATLPVGMGAVSFDATFNFTATLVPAQQVPPGQEQVIDVVGFDRFHWPLNVHVDLDGPLCRADLTVHYDRNAFHPGLLDAFLRRTEVQAQR